MYEKFECIYKKKIKKRYVDLVFILNIILVALILLNYYDIYNIKEYFNFAFLTALISYFLYYLEIIIILIAHKRINKDNWDVIFEIENTLFLYESTISTLDNLSLINMLEELNINSVDKIKLIHDHFHSFIHQKNNRGIDIFSIFFSSIITILPFCLSIDEVEKIKGQYLFLVVLFVFLIFIVVYFLVNIYTKKYGNDALCGFIVNSLSEIMINYDEYKKKYENKIIIVCEDEKLSINDFKNIDKNIELINIKEKMVNENPGSIVFIIIEKGNLKKNIKLLYTISFVEKFIIQNKLKEKVINYNKINSSKMDSKYKIIYKKYVDRFNNTFVIETPKLNTDNKERISDNILNLFNTVLK